MAHVSSGGTEVGFNLTQCALDLVDGIHRGMFAEIGLAGLICLIAQTPNATGNDSSVCRCENGTFRADLAGNR
ncbi:hypothetical protein X949_3497 [Burkholderia pseudomallei MSHR5609]|nr:hypothetical protein X949_3497 [Burkholderia pseudomallei MSHR5609]